MISLDTCRSYKVKKQEFMRRCLQFLFCFLISCASYALEAPVNDTSFWQEYHEAYPLPEEAQTKEVRSIAIDDESNVWIATAGGIYRKKPADSTWTPVPVANDHGPAYAVKANGPSVWIGTWKGVFVSKNNELNQVTGTEGPISVLCEAKEGMYALGPNGAWLCNGDHFQKKNCALARSVRSAISDGKKGLWIATDVGLSHCNGNAASCTYQNDILLSSYIKGLEVDANNKLWAGGLGGISVLQPGKKASYITPKEGCPSAHVNCVKRSPGGEMWVGTRVGVVRFYKDGSHTLLLSRRWLLDDNVKDIAFDKEGNAWLATSAGVSAIKKRKMTLSSKQEYFYDILMRRHIREPWIAGQCRMTVPGDINTWRPDDDDNDGEFTGNYLAMESLRFAVTKSDDAKEKAKKAFHFLMQLQEVTGGDGYFARSIVPVNWKYGVHDENRTYTPSEIAEELVKEPRYKPVEERWRKSNDGKWLWKGDASSDEWCGHMLGYFFYYELTADEEERAVVRKHIALLVDHLIANNFNMMDIDGTHTRWGVWSPDDLNRNPEWKPDRYLNSMELLSFLKLAFYVTGDRKYEEHYHRLIEKEHYLKNTGKLLNQDRAWFIYYDVILQAYLFPILLHCEKDPRLHAFYEQLADQWMARRRNDKSPLINFLYSYARHKEEGLPASIRFLEETPLDLIDWRIDHTKREDVKIVRSPVLDELQVDQIPPVSIRATVRWDKNPWVATDGYPDMEREPVFWLLPYWLGRYLNLIKPV
jgi:hypothetical protein